MSLIDDIIKLTKAYEAQKGQPAGIIKLGRDAATQLAGELSQLPAFKGANLTPTSLNGAHFFGMRIEVT